MMTDLPLRRPAVEMYAGKSDVIPAEIFVRVACVIQAMTGVDSGKAIAAAHAVLKELGLAVVPEPAASPTGDPT